MSADFTPSLEDVIDQAIDDALTDVHTCLPAVIVNYYPDTQTADVQPALKTMYDDGTLLPKPIIPNVPLQFLSGGAFSFSFPVSKGDDVWVFFSERSLERWKAEKGIIDPKDSRKFHLSDAAFCVPTKSRDIVKITGVSPDKVRIVNGDSLIEMDKNGDILLKNTKSSVELSPTGLVELKNDQGKIRITSAGKFKVEGAEELLTIINDLIVCMENATTLTALGPQPFFPPTLVTLGTIKTRLLSIKE